MTLLMRDNENIEKGRAEGRTEAKIETVISMHKNGISKVLIANVTGFSEEKVDEILRNSMTLV